jgi:C4-dicarboxylate transporter DctQ subunit
MVWLAFDLGEKSESSMKFPLWLYYLALPVGTAFMLIELVRRLYAYLFVYDAERMRVTEEHVLRDK